MADYEVLPRDDGKWEARQDGAERASATHATQAEAQQAATDLARSSGGGEVRIHAGDGTIRESHTIGKPDPFPPRG